MITRVAFENYKLLRSVEIGLEPLTVLVGDNATGKTSVLVGLKTALDFTVEQEGEGSLGIHRAGVVFQGSNVPRLLLSQPGTPPLKIEVETEAQLCLRVQASPPPPGVPGHMGTCRLSLVRKQPSREMGEKPIATVVLPPKGNQKPEALFDRPELTTFGPCRYLKLEADRLAEPSYVEGEQPLTHPSGAGLPSLLAYLAGNEPDAKAAIEEDLTSIVPGARRIRTPPARVAAEVVLRHPTGATERVKQEVWGHSLEVEFQHAGFLAAAHLSEGTLLALGLLAELHGTGRPKVLLCDDLERGLHPTAQKTLLRCIRAIQSRHPDLQIIATSHSPYLLDELGGHEVRVMALGDDGSAICRAITDHDEFETWKARGLRTGEFYASVGADWVAGG